jgi:hypothetical protein
MFQASIVGLVEPAQRPGSMEKTAPIRDEEAVFDDLGNFTGESIEL